VTVGLRPDGSRGILGVVLADLPPPATSVLGRPIAVHVRGSEMAPRTLLVVGQVHGDEPAGRTVARAVLRRGAPRGVRLVVVDTLNPDGARAGTRQNARGVDLNRNFPHRWRRAARGRYWPMRLTRAVRPDVTVWLHQPYGITVPTAGVDRRLVARFARIAGLPVRGLPAYRGTAAGWQNARLGNGGAFVAELPAGRPGRALTRRVVRAMRAVAR
jgi:protein MpaA